MKHIPRKRFGQHFLIDKSLIADIVDAIDPRPGQFLVEIGPGLGAITHPLLDRVQHLTVVELDRDLAAHWRKNPRVSVVESDVLKVSFDSAAGTAENVATNAAENSALASGFKGFVATNNIANASPTPPTLRVVGNLPYNISTPILFHLLSFAPNIVDQHFMLQKEVIDRMVAMPSTAAYGRLSVALQWRYDMTRLFNVPPQAFDPPPRVQSAIVRMLPRAQPEPLSLALLEELVQVAFSQRRKLLRHTLGQWLSARGFDGDFDCQRRAEEVPVADFVALAQALGPDRPGPSMST